VTYHVVDADTGTEITAAGSDLIRNGITVPFNRRRRSALLFVEPLADSQTPPAL
jgi:hypothetical protein